MVTLKFLGKTKTRGRATVNDLTSHVENLTKFGRGGNEMTVSVVKECRWNSHGVEMIVEWFADVDIGRARIIWNVVLLVIIELCK